MGKILSTLIRSSTHRYGTCSSFLKEKFYVQSLIGDSTVISNYVLLYSNKLRVQTHKLQKYVHLLYNTNFGRVSSLYLLHNVLYIHV